jgi:uncharacterized membrane protein YqgA involved in biofilm formation
MPGLGTIVNVLGVIAGGLVGLLAGGRLGERMRETLMVAMGVLVIYIAIAGSLQQMLVIGPDGAISTQGTMMAIASLGFGAVVGELADLDGKVERFGQWLRDRTGNSGDARFVDAFVTASLTVCVGAMAVVGAIQDALLADPSVLYAKMALDLVIVMVMTASMGKGCIFSALSIGLFQGSIELLSGLLRPVMTEAALSNLSLVGNMLIFCVGVNLLFDRKIRVANLLPSLVIAVVWALVRA